MGKTERGMFMSSYAKMYRHVFNAGTDAISLLQKAQQEAEEMYMSASDPDVRLLTPDTSNEGEDDSEKE